MRYARGHHEHITLDEAMRFTAGDVGAEPLARTRHLTTDHPAAVCERRFAVDDVEHVGFLVVHLYLTSGLAMAALHEQVRPRHERPAFGERRGDLFRVDMDDAGVTVLRGGHGGDH